MSNWLRRLFTGGTPSQPEPTSDHDSSSFAEADIKSLLHAGQFSRALMMIDQAAASGLSDARAATLRGHVFLAQNNWTNAAIQYRRAIMNGSERALARINLASALLRLGMPYHGLAELDRVQSPGVHDAEATLLRCELLAQTGQTEASEALLLDLLQRQDAPSRALPILVLRWIHRGNAQRAYDFMLEWHRSHGDSAQTHALLGISAYKNHDITRSEQHYRQALAIDDTDAETWDNLGVTIQDLGKIDEAIECYARSAALNPRNPVPRWHASLAYLLDGRFDRGWPDYELRTLNNELQTGITAFPRWNGDSTKTQTVLLVGEQGLGDEIMFASCFRDTIDRSQHTILHCHPKLATLYRRSFPNSTVTTGALLDALAHYPDDAPLIDAALPSGSLPLVLGRDQHNFPAARPYLYADPDATERWRQRLRELGTGLKIGLSWRGGTLQTRHALRSMALRDWLPVLQIPGAQFVSLQYTPDASSDLAAFKRDYDVPLVHWQEAIDDYDQTAALVTALDLVISVQTAVIHLAGALGQRTWVLVPACPEWRYQRHGDRMPWYENVKLYRQSALGEWSTAVARVAADLARLTGATTSAASP